MITQDTYGPATGRITQQTDAKGKDHSVDVFDYDRLYNNFGSVIPVDAKLVVRRSADRHAAWVRGDYDHLT